MRNIILAAVIGLGLGAAPASAQQEYKTVFGSDDFNLIVGYKLWLNNWATWNTGESGVNYVQVSKAGVANVINTTLRYKQFFTNLGFMVAPEYQFPRYTDRTAAGALNTVDLKVSRNEFDWNIGAMVVPQLGFTGGLKFAQQHWKQSTNGGSFGNGTKWNWFGPTLGVLGSAAIGNGFSLYGNGAGGIMFVKQDPEPTTARNDTASYESAELGLAWRAKSVPLSASFGYRFQRIYTRLDVTGFRELVGNDITTGYTLGLNLLF